mgnify:CR=1 FL=1
MESKRNKNSSKTTDDQSRIIRELAPYLTLGWQLGITFGLFALGGWWLDKQSGGGSTWTVVGSALGFVVGMYSFFKTVLKKDNKKQAKDKKEL